MTNTNINIDTCSGISSGINSGISSTISTNTDIGTIIAHNKYRFYEFYYETRDDYVIHATDSDTPDTFSKPSAQICMLVKRVFDNYLVIPDMNDFLKIVEILRFCNDLISNGDIFELVNVSSMNILFLQLYNYSIILSELENGGIMVKNILSHINTQKLKSGLLECLIYIIYKNLVDVTGMASRTNSHDIRTMSISSSDIATSPGESIAKMATYSSINIYNYIIQWTFAKYKDRMFWMTSELYSGCLKLLRFNTILSEDTCVLISHTLKRFIRTDLLINKLTHQWHNDFELTESLNLLKNKIITKDQQWIKQLLKQSYTHAHAHTQSCCSQLLQINPSEFGKKVNLVLIDGANWFYNPKSIGAKSNLLREEIDSIGTPVWNDVIIGRIRLQLRDKFSYEPNDQFIKNMRIVIVFNERHKPFINQICTDLDQFIIYTPRGMNDDAMLLYLWLSNPGAFLFSNDKYNDWGNYVMGNQYLMGLWEHWITCMKISK